MSLVTVKARLCTAKVTSLITHKVPRRKIRIILKAAGIMVKVGMTTQKKTHKEQICVNKHLLYRRANILTMYNCTER